MKACCFIGHRDIKKTPELSDKIRRTVKNLIEAQGVDVFLFGGKSEFDDLCVRIVRGIKAERQEIQLIFVRENNRYIGEKYTNLLKVYDDSVMMSGTENAGKASYVERNQAMINASDFCVFYYDENYTPSGKRTKSGTKVAYEYAKKKGKNIINLYN